MSALICVLDMVIKALFDNIKSNRREMLKSISIFALFRIIIKLQIIFIY